MTEASFDVKQMWAEAQDRNRRWRECPKHRFPEKPDGYRLGDKPRCLVCGVDAKLGEIGDYIRGYQAAGGNAADIMPDWKA